MANHRPSCGEAVGSRAVPGSRRPTTGGSWASGRRPGGLLSVQHATPGNAQQSANQLGHTVLLQVNTEPIVKRVLEITNFLDHFDHVSSREEALAWSDNQLET